VDHRLAAIVVNSEALKIIPEVIEMLKRLAAATLMLCAAGGALADDQAWDIGAVPVAPNSYYAVVTHAFGSFIDTITFIVPDGSLGVAANILPVPDATDGVGFSGHISNLTYAIWDINNVSQGNYAGGLSVSHTTLTAGSYTLTVSGNADGNFGGTYGLNMAVTPVPEPATYGMLLVGLGLLGFASKRRDASNDKFM
jgi:hypothetical protein